MSATDPTAGTDGFGAADFAALQALEETSDGTAPALTRRLDALWHKTARLAGGLAGELFGRGGGAASVWPDDSGESRGPFLWIRLKRAGNERFATHLGIFLSPGGCNLALDLEKDLLAAGESAESLEQVIAFDRNGLAAALPVAGRLDLVVWTDADNVVPAADFADIDFDAFMAANDDADHPWPKVGYLLNPADVQAFGDRWIAECRARLAPLVQVYDALIAATSARGRKESAPGTVP